LAPPLLLTGNIKAIEGAIHEDVNRDNVQEGAGAQDPSAGIDLQALWYTDLLVELLESSSRVPR
jgi:hypothetical protein